MIRITETMYCDLCGKHIDKSAPIFMGSYEHFKTKHYGGRVYGTLSIGKKRDTKESVDVCCDCAQEISETIQRLVNGL